jgi:hypothetical protein
MLLPEASTLSHCFLDHNFHLDLPALDSIFQLFEVALIDIFVLGLPKSGFEVLQFSVHRDTNISGVTLLHAELGHLSRQRIK